MGYKDMLARSSIIRQLICGNPSCACQRGKLRGLHPLFPANNLDSLHLLSGFVFASLIAGSYQSYTTLGQSGGSSS